LEILESRTLLSAFTVDRLTDDNLAGGGEGSGRAGDLRYCLTNAADGDVVTFGVTGTIWLSGALPDVTQRLSIAGPGADALTVSGNHLTRVLNIAAAADVVIFGLTIADGQVAAGVNGGGISNAGTLTIDDCALNGNITPAVVVGGSGGAIYNVGILTVVDSTFSGNVGGGGGGGRGGGGGIFNQGTLTIVGSTFSNNFAIIGGGIDNGANRTTVIDSIFSGNSARGEGSGGAGIGNFGTMTVIDSAFSGNVATDTGGGGIVNFFPGTLTVSSSAFSGNSAFDGGAIDNLATFTITGSTFSNNDAVGTGGAIDNDIVGVMTVTNCTLNGNSAFTDNAHFGGGGILNLGALTLASSTVSGNFATGGGGGIDNHNTGGSRPAVLRITNSTLSDNSAGSAGGGIINDGSVTPTRARLDITSSTLDNNSALGGGAIDNTAGVVTITSSTLSNNSAASGGAIHNHDLGIFNDGTVTVTSSTISGNSATQTGGGLDEATSRGSTTVRNSIVAANTAPSSPDVSGSLVSQGHNLIGDGTGGSGFIDSDLVGTGDATINPMLGPLQDNGGPMETMALLPGSPALNAGDPGELGVADQRGVIRSAGVNIGAYQASASAFLVTAPATVIAAMPFDLIVTAVDPFGQLAAGYAGTVMFSTSDQSPGVVLPADYTFTAADGGAHTFTDTGLGETTLVTPGRQTVAVGDMVDPSIVGDVAVQVQDVLRHDNGGHSVLADREVAAADRFFAMFNLSKGVSR
jgi:hypothetical protein